MSAAEPDDLERRLAELFQQRAATVTQARRVDLAPHATGRKAAGMEPVPVSRRRQSLGLLAAAAAVFVAIAGTVVGIQAGRHMPERTATGNPTGPSRSSGATGGPSVPGCVVAMPASWQRAITAGAFGVDRTLTSVVSANAGTGDYLAIQGEPVSSTNIYANLEVALFHGTKGKTLYRVEGSGYFAQADPTGAIAADWVTFAIAYPHSPDYRFKVMLYQRGTGVLRTLAGGADQPDPEHKLVRGAPVLAAGKVYWLASVDNHPETTTLESWDLARGAAAGSVPAADAAALVPYGNGVALVHALMSGDPGLTLVNGAGTPLTRAQLQAAAGGSDFSFDGTDTLSWLRHANRSVGYSSLVGGRDAVRSEPMIGQPTDVNAGPPPVYAGIGAALYPFTPAEVRGSEGLLDLRTGAAVAFPSGLILQAVVGDSVVFGTGSHFAGATASGSAGLSIVALGALSPVRC